MKIGDAVRKMLLGASGVTDLVGAGSAARIHPLRRPQDGALPALTYEILSTPDRPKTQDGVSGLVSPIMRIHVWAETYAAQQDLGDAVRSALDAQSFSGSEGVIHALFLEDERELYEEPEDGGDVGTYHTVLEFRLWHQE